jgi:hypothetical protein
MAVPKKPAAGKPAPKTPGAKCGTKMPAKKKK